MTRSPRSCYGFVFCLIIAACGSSGNSGAGGSGGTTAGSGGTSGSGSGGMTGGGTGGSSGTGGARPGSGGAAGSGGTSGSGGALGADAGGGDAPPAGTTSLTGTLGMLGAVKPTVSSFVISNSGETLIYMSSAALTCPQIMVSRWLGMATAGSQVVEIVVPGAPKVGTVQVGPGEVNYAAGGKSSAYEVNAQSGSITFTAAMVNGPVQGTVMATYAGGGNVMGTFSAEFCAGGQGY